MLAAFAISLWAGLAQAATVNASDKDSVAEVEHYLNSVETLKARFIQIAANGASAEGDLYLARPGRMRMNYDPPTEIEIVADTRFLIYHDKKLEQVSYLGLDSSPAGIMLRPHVKLSGDVTVTKVQHLPGALEVSVVQTEDPAAGELTMLLTEKPMNLRQWRVRDAQGQVVTVSLFSVEHDVTLNPDLFDFKDPKIFKP